MAGTNLGFIDFFKAIPDHRIDRHKRYSTEELLLIAFCGTLAGCDSWNDLELFAKTKLEMLRHYLPYKHGAPSDDTLRRFFRALDPVSFERCFVEWVQSFQLDLADKVIAVDGKTSRRSFDGESRAMHMVSAFVSELGITLGQEKTAEKSNEITAIPKLLELLDIENAIVTLDAMGCQTKIADLIVNKGSDYVFGLKGNQGELNEDVRDLLSAPPHHLSVSSGVEIDAGHGRLENRHCRVINELDWLKERHPHWSSINSVIELESEREIKGQQTREKRYYISSLDADADRMNTIIRQHWGVENSLHWVLDMSFNDDQSRIRKGNAPQNMAILKKTALNVFQIMKKAKPRVSIKAMRKMAGWDQNFMDELLMSKF